MSRRDFRNYNRPGDGITGKVADTDGTIIGGVFPDGTKFGSRKGPLPVDGSSLGKPVTRGLDRQAAMNPTKPAMPPIPRAGSDPAWKRIAAGQPITPKPMSMASSRPTMAPAPPKAIAPTGAALANQNIATMGTAGAIADYQRRSAMDKAALSPKSSVASAPKPFSKSGTGSVPPTAGPMQTALNEAKARVAGRKKEAEDAAVSAFAVPPVANPQAVGTPVPATPTPTAAAKPVTVAPKPHRAWRKPIVDQPAPTAPAIDPQTGKRPFAATPIGKVAGVIGQGVQGAASMTNRAMDTAKGTYAGAVRGAASPADPSRGGDPKFMKTPIGRAVGTVDRAISGARSGVGEGFDKGAAKPQKRRWQTMPG